MIDVSWWLFPALRRARLFVDGAFSDVSNPKIAVLRFAFLPQFVLPGATHRASGTVLVVPGSRLALERPR